MAGKPSAGKSLSERWAGRRKSKNVENLTKAGPLKKIASSIKSEARGLQYRAGGGSAGTQRLKAGDQFIESMKNSVSSNRSKTPKRSTSRGK